MSNEELRDGAYGLSSLSEKTREFADAMGFLQLSDHVLQNRQTGEQKTHWDILNKENSNMVALFNMSQCVICSSVRRF